MLRVTTLYASSAAATAKYYTRYLTDAPGEVPGQWIGHQSDLLGLTGTVSTEALEGLLSGLDPVSGEMLGYPLADRSLANGKVIRAVAGFDATFSAPKSVSVLWALTGDEGYAGCHDVAVQAVLAYLERYGSTTRIRSNGRRLHPDSQGLIAAAFRQTTSRGDDPQLHTHVVISSKVQTADGRWLALDARFLKRYQRALGGLYQSVLRAELTSRYAVAFSEIVNGQAEIDGVPDELLAQFSKRTVEVDSAVTVKVAEFYTREGRDPTRWERAALTRQAAADTRVHKSGNSVDDLRGRWLDEAADLGITPEDLTASVAAAARTRTLKPPVTTAEVVEALSATGSAWHRVEVLRTICDLQRPIPGVGGNQWAANLERATDRVIEHCVDIDPTHGDGSGVRRSDGRSEWIEPVAAHITSAEILAQEEAILTWAIDTQLGNPQPSTSLSGAGLDVLQHDAAAAVAGAARLSVIVGPAGTGKTTMLRAAVDDLHAHGRFVFGVSPTAKAARTLERETAMRCDTVAKLVHEWTRPDRPPEQPWRLPTWTTLIVDEAGMLGTGNLHQLIQLADQHRWRLALVGDPRQLHAVGRGGMFNELCRCARTIELEHVHRFEQPWEAHASLLLRQGDPKALDIYEAHKRIRAGTIDEHLDYFADEWLQQHADGETTAVMASTNQHVDRINTHIQDARRERLQIDDGHGVAIGGGERAYVGDVVATRRNHRHLTTTSGERVRNRDQWTVLASSDNGDLTVSPLGGHGQIALPANYVAEHVRLGYAATEMGTQSDTVTSSFELASRATTCRALYVAMTRGERDNTVCVITETHDPAEARDILETIIAVDRADVPATTQRQQLATQDHQPIPRCPIPDWFDDLRSSTIDRLEQARTKHAQSQQQQDQLRRRLSDAERRRQQARLHAEPFDHAVDAANTALTQATAEQRALEQRLSVARRRDRKSIKVELAAADVRIDSASAARQDAHRAAHPTSAEVANAWQELTALRREQQREQLFARWSGSTDAIEILEQRLGALDTWHQWASGAILEPRRINEVVTALFVAKDPTGHLTALRTTLLKHPYMLGVHQRPKPEPIHPRPPTISIG
jgi:conjugative relaxase-like TrwC/TraI family protein